MLTQVQAHALSETSLTGATEYSDYSTLLQLRLVNSFPFMLFSMPCQKASQTEVNQLEKVLIRGVGPTSKLPRQPSNCIVLHASGARLHTKAPKHQIYDETAHQKGIDQGKSLS